jgi:fructokinase
MTDKHAPIFCFGEILWDCLPAGLFLGGAPVNVAYHLQQQGLPAVPVTAVGDDFLGKEICRRLERWKLTTRAVQEIPEWPTGVVTAELDDSGNASYSIVENVAWDHITPDESLVKEVAQADALIFGSLAQRSDTNRESLDRLLANARHIMKVFDVNFRPPYDDHDRTLQLAQIADLVKLNHEEAAALTGGSPEDFEAKARAFSEHCGEARICITAGEAGAGMLHAGDWSWEKGRSVDVADTVGAGDSFLATLVRGLLEDHSVEEILGEACRIAEWVATQRGAQPDYNNLEEEKET